MSTLTCPLSIAQQSQGGRERNLAGSQKSKLKAGDERVWAPSEVNPVEGTTRVVQELAGVSQWNWLRPWGWGGWRKETSPSPLPANKRWSGSLL